MRKNELIELLQSFEGNPEVVMWNGFVQDYMHLDNIVKTTLVKPCNDYYRLHNRGITDVECNKLRREENWSFPNMFISSEQEYKKWYGNHEKKVLIISTKLRGETYSDRVGKMEY